MSRTRISCVNDAAASGPLSQRLARGSAGPAGRASPSLTNTRPGRRPAGGTGAGAGGPAAPRGVRVARGALVRARRKLAVGVAHREKVPGTDLLRVELAEVERPVGTNEDLGRGIVHDRGAPRRARGEVVGEAERVADLVRGELADARER